MRREPHYPEYSGLCGSFLFLKTKGKEDKDMKENRFATNKGGVIKAPKATSKGDPKATVTKGSDLRGGKGGK
jgi:hypothetical protein